MLKNTYGRKLGYNSSRINQPAHNKQAAQIGRLSQSYSRTEKLSVQVVRLRIFNERAVCLVVEYD